MAVRVLEDLRICREERDILKQKLHILLDHRTLDKIMFEQSAAKAAEEDHLKEAEYAYEIARRDLRLGSQQQQLLVLKLKLESAVEDTELREMQLSALQVQLQEERKWLKSANQKVWEMKASLPLKVASESKKLNLENERKMHHLQKLLDDTLHSHKVELEKIKGRHTSVVTQLREEIQLLVPQNVQLKAQQVQWNLERKELQALLQDRDNLRAEQEQWNLDKKGLHALLQERDDLRAEQKQWNSFREEVQTIMEEKDSLLAEKGRGILCVQEMQEVVNERDRLKVQQELWLTKEEDMQQLVKELDKLKHKLEGRVLQHHEDLVKERDELKHKLELSDTKREVEVKALVRERDFVWSQMKIMEEGYGERIKKMAGRVQQDKQEIERLKQEMQEAQVGTNETMVEMTILKLEGKRIQDQAIQKQGVLEADMQELHCRLEKAREENKRLVADGLKRESLCLELTTQKEALDKKLESLSYQIQEEGPAGGAVKDGPEVLNVGEGLTLDHEIFESQVEQATQVDGNDNKKLSKQLEDQHRENENLRREIVNLKTLYAEVEDNLHRKRQKPNKAAASKANHRDSTSRNLKLELEAAATCCPSNENPVSDKKSRKLKKIKSGNKKDPPSTKSTQKKNKIDFSEPDPEGVDGSEQLEGFRRDTRSCKRKLSDKKCPSDKISLVLSPKTSRLRSQADVLQCKVPALNAALEQHDVEPVQKRLKKADDKGDLEATQHQRPPLHTLPHNQKSSAKSAVQLPSGSKGASHKLENKTLLGSPTKTSRMMANLFSTSFSVPKLKNVLTPVGFRT